MAESAKEIKAQIDAALSDIDRLPVMPAIAQRAIALAYNPDVDIKQLAEEISRDPAMTAGILRLSNSAYFRPASKVRSISEAIVVLGLNVVKDIIIITASRDILKVDLEGFKLEAAELWDHSLLVAELCARIADKKKVGIRRDIAFTAGLLHDVGKVIMASHFRRLHIQVQMEMQKHPDSRFSDMERKFTGYTSTELGGRLLGIWKFPDELIEAVRDHYFPEKATVNPELCSIVHIGNVIALASGVGIDIGGLNESLSSFAISTLRLTGDELSHLYDSLPEIMEYIFDMRSL